MTDQERRIIVLEGQVVDLDDRLRRLEGRPSDRRNVESRPVSFAPATTPEAYGQGQQGDGE